MWRHLSSPFQVFIYQVKAAASHTRPWDFGSTKPGMGGSMSNDAALVWALTLIQNGSPVLTFCRWDISKYKLNKKKSCSVQKSAHWPGYHAMYFHYLVLFLTILIPLKLSENSIENLTLGSWIRNW